jgi:glycosyltransferase involved in cell wall biosynthesis
VIQALQEGLPVITTDIGDIASMITDEQGRIAGVLVPADTDDDRFMLSLVNALQSMLGQESRERAADIATRLRTRYDIQQVSLAYARLYRSLIRRGLAICVSDYDNERNEA